MLERSMRVLTQIYNERNYLPSTIGFCDETEGHTDNLSFDSKPSCHASEGGDILLEEDEILSEYETYKFEEMNDIAASVNQIDTPAPITPCPEFSKNSDPKTLFSHEQLTFEMNKLYLEQFNEKFNKFTPVSKTAMAKDEINDSTLKSPPKPKKLTPLARYTGDESDFIYSKQDRKSKRNISIQDLGKNYMQIEDHLLQKLMQVEDKTIREWLNKKLSEEKVGGYQFQM